MSEIPTSWNNEELIRTSFEVARRAAADDEFMKLALRDGAAAIPRVDPKPLPPGIVVKFVDNRGPLKTIPLPAPADTDEFGEITEEELEAVAGGHVAVCVYCTCGSITYST